MGKRDGLRGNVSQLDELVHVIIVRRSRGDDVRRMIHDLMDDHRPDQGISVGATGSATELLDRGRVVDAKGARAEGREVGSDTGQVATEGNRIGGRTKPHASPEAGEFSVLIRGEEEDL